MLSLLETRKLRHKEISHFANVPSDRVRIPPQSTQPQSLGFFSVLHCLHHIAYHVIVMHLPTCLCLADSLEEATDILRVEFDFTKNVGLNVRIKTKSGY